MPTSALNSSTPSTPGNQHWVHVTITMSTSKPSPVKGEKTPTPPPATAQDGWNDDRFLRHNHTPTSSTYSGPVETKKQCRAKKAAVHPGLSWTACYNDQLPMYLDAKQRHDWFPKKLSKKGKEPGREMEWETAYDAEPGSDWSPPSPTKKERRAHKDLVTWQHCFTDNCSVHRWEEVDAGSYPRIVGKDGVWSKRDMTHHKC